MKSKLFFLIALAMAFIAFAQTDGTLSATYTIPVPTSPAPWTAGTTNTNYYAAYISDSSGNTVRVIHLYTGKKDHLSTFAGSIGCTLVAATSTKPEYYNALDNVATKCKNHKNNAVVPVLNPTTTTTFVSGATRTDATTPTGFGTITLTWDGKIYDDTTGTISIAPDGDYKLNIEMSWSTSVLANGHDEMLIIPFTKSKTITNATPVTDTYVTSSAATWTPAGLATSEVTARNEFRIVPNPANDIFQVKTLEKIKVINVFDLSGRLVKSFQKADSYNVSSLKAGNYFLEIKAESGVAYQKLIKK